MIIKKVDGLGVDLGSRWIRHDNPEFPKGNLYTEDEFEIAVKSRLERQNFVRLEDYKELQDKYRLAKHVLETFIKHSPQ